MSVYINNVNDFQAFSTDYSMIVLLLYISQKNKFREIKFGEDLNLIFT